MSDMRNRARDVMDGWDTFWSAWTVPPCASDRVRRLFAVLAAQIERLRETT